MKPTEFLAWVRGLKGGITFGDEKIGKPPGFYLVSRPKQPVTSDEMAGWVKDWLNTLKQEATDEEVFVFVREVFQKLLNE